MNDGVRGDQSGPSSLCLVLGPLTSSSCTVPITLNAFTLSSNLTLGFADLTLEFADLTLEFADLTIYIMDPTRELACRTRCSIPNCSCTKFVCYEGLPV
jgi:hypothetical protein